MSLESPKKIEILRDRARMLRHARAFFDDRGVLETDCPIISPSAAIDAHIDLIPALDVLQNKRYLHSSPEYGMKRLLAQGMGDIYQLSHVFRQGEQGVKHNPEFMMAEWYRLGITFEQIMSETAEFIRLFLGYLPSETISYREALLKYTGIDYVYATV
jgi:lysyl-tRNA synthetase class 2